MITGEKVNIRHVQYEDIDFIFNAFNYCSLNDEFSLKKMKSIFLMKKEFENHGFAQKNNELLCITDKAGKPIAATSHIHIDSQSQCREIGLLVFGKDCRGKGIATESLTLLTQYLFTNIPIHRLQFCTSVLNTPAIKLAKKCGYQLEGTLRESLFLGGKYRDISIYSMLRREYENLNIL